MFPSALSAGALYPNKIIVGHPYNPSYLLPLIEVCGPHADEATIETAMNVYRAIGKEPVLCRKEVEGFIVNKLSWGAMKACIDAVMGGVCSVEDIDKAIMYGPGMRMAVTGQVLTLSLGVQGGLRGAAAKYGKEPNKEDLVLADGVDEEIAHRPAEFGNTVEDVIRFRDRAFADILKIHHKL
jgi:carnitine 3-dehydrogenase